MQGSLASKTLSTKFNSSKNLFQYWKQKRSNSRSSASWQPVAEAHWTLGGCHILYIGNDLAKWPIWNFVFVATKLFLRRKKEKNWNRFLFFSSMPLFNTCDDFRLNSFYTSPFSNFLCFSPCSISPCLSLSQTLSVSLSLPFSNSLCLSQSQTYSVSLFLKLSLSLSFSSSICLSLSQTLSVSLSLPFSNSIGLSLSLSFSICSFSTPLCFLCLLVSLQLSPFFWLFHQDPVPPFLLFSYSFSLSLFLLL